MRIVDCAQSVIRNLQSAIRNPGRLFLLFMASAGAVYPLAVFVLLTATALFPRKVSFAEPWGDPAIRHAFWLSILTSVMSAALAVAVAIPSGYVLSRWRFPGRRLMDILLYLPIALPPLVIGVSLLIFFQT
ncbi:MAG: molybdenum ABC transporter permease, partial [Candidatus Hydrogenedentes bacterium]|nr:molybdenum ABC transporter permease [Candidatus Hydrogenedentota bacterium]